MGNMIEEMFPLVPSSVSYVLYRKAILRSLNDTSSSEVRVVTGGASACQYVFHDGWNVRLDETGIGIFWGEGMSPKKSWILTSLVVRLNEIVENHGTPQGVMPPTTTYDGYMIKSYELRFMQKPQSV